MQEWTFAVQGKILICSFNLTLTLWSCPRSPWWLVVQGTHHQGCQALSVHEWSKERSSHFGRSAHQQCQTPHVVGDTNPNLKISAPQFFLSGIP